MIWKIVIFPAVTSKSRPNKPRRNHRLSPSPEGCHLTWTTRKRRRRKKKKSVNACTLSLSRDALRTLAIIFSAPPPVKRRRFGKNPTVDTSFLPDRDREVRVKERKREKERETDRRLEWCVMTRDWWWHAMWGHVQEEERMKREKLRQEWVEKQDKIKSWVHLTLPMRAVIVRPSRLFGPHFPHNTDEEIGITYSYWDGSGHRRQVKVGVT